MDWTQAEHWALEVGCIAHAKVNTYLNKLDDRSQVYVYLGTEPGSKAHRLYDPVKGKVHVSRDVVFQEEKEWEWDNLSKDSRDMRSWVTLEAG